MTNNDNATIRNDIAELRAEAEQTNKFAMCPPKMLLRVLDHLDTVEAQLATVLEAIFDECDIPEGILQAAGAITDDDGKPRT